MPAGSTLLVQVHGGRRVPDLTIDGTATPLGAIAGGDYSATAKLTGGQHLTVVQSGTELAKLDLSIVPDLPPTAEFGAPPAATPSAALRLDYRATDDYGVAGLRLEIRRVEAEDEGPLTIDLPAGGTSRKELHGTTYQDLTAHPWAGLPAELRLIATDATGQTGASKPLRITLPERQFHHPVAKAIIEQRKLLVLHPDQADVVAETLGDLSIQPSFFRNDFAVFMGLRAAVQSLARQPVGAELANVEQMMWEIALKIEDGNVPDAQKSLREAQQALQDALARDAPDAEIQKLMRDLRAAIQRYLQAMIENAQKDGQEADQQSGPSRTLSPQDIDRMLNQAEQMARSGLQGCGAPGAGGAAGPAGIAEDRQARARAGRQPRRQGDAADAGSGAPAAAIARPVLSAEPAQRGRSAGPAGKDGQRGAGKQPGAPGDSGDLAGAQEGLRRQLDQLRQQMGEQGGQAGQSLDRADKAMEMRSTRSAAARARTRSAARARRSTSCTRRRARWPTRCATRTATRTARRRTPTPTRSAARRPARAAWIAATWRSPNSRKCRKAARSWTNCAAAPANARDRPWNGTTSIGCCSGFRGPRIRTCCRTSARPGPWPASARTHGRGWRI